VEAVAVEQAGREALGLYSELVTEYSNFKERAQQQRDWFDWPQSWLPQSWLLWEFVDIGSDVYVEGQRAGDTFQTFSLVGSTIESDRFVSCSSDSDALTVRICGIPIGGARVYLGRQQHLRCTCCGSYVCLCPSSAVHAACFRCRLHCQCHGGG
jgi:hypothetical protein